ncbi:MAG: TrmH family RNA methyltransferase [Gemmatimonadaceae bacterium]|nr:TrmH family RNA methyltransferase [Gemmatimonadaceae bacterium]
MSLLDHLSVVFLFPQDPVNIAATVRAMKNMGVHDLRLVRPCPYDPFRIEGVAHDTRDIVERIRHFDTLDEALADCGRVVAFAGKRRSAKWERLTPRVVADRYLPDLQSGHRVALLFGQEDHGLPNDALDRAQVLCMIPTTEHSSLNLAQAVLVALYEFHVAAGDATRKVEAHRHQAGPATHEEWERMFADTEAALDAIAFFRTRNPELVMRSIRSLAFRAKPDEREVTMLRAVAIEVLRTIDRITRGLAKGPWRRREDAGAPDDVG